MLVLGTVAIDSVETPFGRKKAVLGGSASYAAYSASFFAPVRLVACVGSDFPERYTRVLRERPIDTAGLERVPHERTFRWRGRYGADLGEATTLATHLNVLERFNPNIPLDYLDTPCVFLANIDPVIQERVLNHLKPRWVVLDSMNYWIQHKRKDLLRVAKRADLVVLNDAEARGLAQEASLVHAARRLKKFGLKRLIIKKGEHGALLFEDDKFFLAPAYPQPATVDPTGCGDAFAGGLTGFLASQKKITRRLLRRSVIAGSVMASFTIEDFGLKRLRRLTHAEIRNRLTEFHDLIRC